MDYEFMKQINDHRIQKEIDARIAQDALREKARQEKQDKRETAIFITGLVLCVLVAGLLGEQKGGNRDERRQTSNL